MLPPLTPPPLTTTAAAALPPVPPVAVAVAMVEDLTELLLLVELPERADMTWRKSASSRFTRMERSYT